MVAKIGCEHVAFVVHHDVNRLSKVEGGPVEMFTLSADVTCYDCGMEFKRVEVKLEPSGRTDVKRPELVTDKRSMN